MEWPKEYKFRAKKMQEKCSWRRIFRLQPDGSGAAVFANTGGRPLGLHFDRRGNLIVADTHRGLLAIHPSGTIELLVNSAGGVPFRFTDDVDIARG